MAGRAFISGISGQDGAYLAKLLIEKGYEVHGGVRRVSSAPAYRLENLGIGSDVILHDFEIGEITSIQRVLDEVAPDEIYNLAAQSVVAASFDQPIYTSNINAIGALRILEVLRQAGSRARFYQASTSEMFGAATASVQNEETPFRPRSPYGFAKLFAHWATVNYREAFGMFACAGILFNHESPLRGRGFVTRKITTGLARISDGSQEMLLLGNINARRDWGFAGDYVDGMWRMLQSDKADDYVLASGESHTVRQFVELAAHVFGWTLVWRGKGLEEEGFDAASGRLLVKVNPVFYRPPEAHASLGSPLKAERVLGWRRRVTFADLVTMMAEADRRGPGDSERP